MLQMDLVIVFCTILYINGLPVDYCIHHTEGNVFEFEPFFNPHENLEAPEFKILQRRGAWMIDRLLEINVRDQAIEALVDFLNNHKQ